mmetsp:Transcript_4620/g.5014  ORF Transcript_4620/g.5014 Transcript_4620/m.5014 type:complete len:316 (+) Transcript_4620:70-1017(+)
MGNKSAKKTTEAAEPQIFEITLCGLKGSGKRTLLKQLQFVFGGKQPSISATDIRMFMIDCIKVLIDISHMKGFEIDEPNKDFAKTVSGKYTWGDDTHKILTSLWNDTGIQRAHDIRLLHGGSPCMARFFDAIDRIAKSGYIPTSDDNIQARLSHPIEDVTFEYWVGTMDKTIRFVNKECTELPSDTKSVYYMVSLLGYCQSNGVQNNLIRAIEAFNEIKTKLKDHTNIVLIFSKQDLMDKQLETTPITACFPDYTQPPQEDWGKFAAFLQSKFIDNDDKVRVYTHFISPICYRNVKDVFEHTLGPLFPPTGDMPF